MIKVSWGVLGCLMVSWGVLWCLGAFSLTPSPGEERANLCAFRTFVRFLLVWFCRFLLPLGVWEGLRFVIVTLWTFHFFFFFFFFAANPTVTIIIGLVQMLNDFDRRSTELSDGN